MITTMEKENQMYLISLYFDEKSNRILQSYIEKIAEATGNDYLISHHVPPHMTISAIEARNASVLEPAFLALEGKLCSDKIQIVSVGQLLPYVFYATPVLSAYLLELSQTIYDAFVKIPETKISRYYRPLSWLPHITLGKTLTKDQMRKALEVMQDHFTPFEAKITEIGLSKVNPYEDVGRFQLIK